MYFPSFCLSHRPSTIISSYISESFIVQLFSLVALLDGFRAPSGHPGHPCTTPHSVGCCSSPASPIRAATERTGESSHLPQALHSERHPSHLLPSNLQQPNAHQPNMQHSNLHQPNVPHSNLHQPNVPHSNLHQPNILHPCLQQWPQQQTKQQPSIPQRSLQQCQQQKHLTSGNSLKTEPLINSPVRKFSTPITAIISQVG